MQEAVSGILISRSREVEGLNRMLMISLLAHGLLLVALVVVPRDWLSSNPPAQEKPMMISLASVAGPNVGGLTPVSSRTIQEKSTEAKPAVTPPAVKAPSMVVPEATAKPSPVTKPVEKPIEKSSTRKPSTGAEVKTGAARAETHGAEVQFGGLASGGGGTGGARVEGDFCCPEYLETMKQLIYANWNRQLGAPGHVEVKFTIRRDGMIANVGVETPSNNPLLDLESRRAVLVTQQLPRLPDRYTNPSLTVYLIFEYKR
jgi:TonB family protein